MAVRQRCCVRRCLTGRISRSTRTTTRTTRPLRSGATSATCCSTTRPLAPSSVWLTERGAPIYHPATVRIMTTSPLRRVHCIIQFAYTVKISVYPHGYFVASFPYFNGTGSVYVFILQIDGILKSGPTLQCGNRVPLKCGKLAT